MKKKLPSNLQAKAKQVNTTLICSCSYNCWSSLHRAMQVTEWQLTSYYFHWKNCCHWKQKCHPEIIMVTCTMHSHKEEDMTKQKKTRSSNSNKLLLWHRKCQCALCCWLSMQWGQTACKKGLHAWVLHLETQIYNQSYYSFLFSISKTNTENCMWTPVMLKLSSSVPFVLLPLSTRSNIHPY